MKRLAVAKPDLPLRKWRNGQTASCGSPLSRPVQEIGLAAHNEVHKVEQENVGVEAGHKGEELAERSAAYTGSKTKAAIRHHHMKP